MDDVTRLSRCVRCGAALPAGWTDLMCAACLQATADAPTVLPSPTVATGDAPTYLSGPSSGGVASADALTIAAPMGSASGEHPTFLSPGAGTGRRVDGPRPAPGAEFGPYRIERPLGSGGMGDVYEAEHREHGRRVALKVLSQRLATGEDRARFLREGELAASITHSNTVYIYGSEEIGGAPVIAMELLPGGTLKDLVQQRGPLPSQAAVDLILQVIAGLEAAEAAGILHRDIKPANCFIDHNGGVKVGDFGLSVAASGRENSASGMFQGTPQFAPPEQIQGQALDVRADIYAVGATLFYLLTGQPPFDDPDITTLISRVKMEAPRSAREMRAGVPVDLAAVVTRCLAKNREARPPSYAALRDLLRAFSSSAPAPAPLGRRFLAGAIDQATLVVLNIPIAAPLLARFPNRPSTRWTISFIQILLTVLYYGVLEGTRGAGLGKRLCGLVVARVNGQRPGLAKGLGRGAIWVISPTLTLIIMAIMGAQAFTRFTLEQPGMAVLLSAGGLTFQVLVLFSRARRRNGFAGLHDLATGTRVVMSRVSGADRIVQERARAAATTGPRVRQLGPFDVAETLGSTDGGELWLANDPRLKRQVWILERPSGAPPIAPALRDLGRPVRLRWLGGRRTAGEAWDVFEAFDGRALVALDAPRPWPVVKHWLVDLAVEIDHGLADGSLPPLTLDRVWVTAAGNAKLLDFPAPGLPLTDATDHADAVKRAQVFLARVASRGLSGGALPGTLPLSARATLDRLATGAFPSSSAVVTALTNLLSRPDVVAPWRRVSSVVLCGVAPVLLGLLGFVVAFVLRQAPSGAEALALDLQHLSDLSTSTDANAPAERHALEVYIAATYSSTIQNELTWSIVASGKPMKTFRLLAVRAVDDHPTVTAEELAAAKTTLAPFLVEEAKVRQGSDRRASIAPFVVPGYLFMAGLGTAALFGVVLAVVFRGGLLLAAFGIAVVTLAGEKTSRVRAGLRAFVAWAPAGLSALGAWAANIHFTSGYTVGYPVVLALAAIAFLVFIAGVIVAGVNTTRGIQDSVAGTRLVPR